MCGGGASHQGRPIIAGDRDGHRAVGVLCRFTRVKRPLERGPGVTDDLFHQPSQPPVTLPEPSRPAPVPEPSRPAPVPEPSRPAPVPEPSVMEITIGPPPPATVGTSARAVA